MDTPCWQVGLTGGIGSGKSTVAAMLADCGATIIDADRIARELTAPGGAAMPAIAAAFGPELVAADGALDRARMRTLAFTQPEARQRLEAIIHPLVGQETGRQAPPARAPGAAPGVPGPPLAGESGHWRRRVEAGLVVGWREGPPVGGVVGPNHLPPAAGRGPLARQASRSQRRACADLVVYNDGLSLDALRSQVSLAARRFGL